MQFQELKVADYGALNIEGLLIPKFPTLWRGIGTEWSCTRTWTFAGLSERFSGRKIRVRITDDEIDALFKRTASESPFDQFIYFDEYIDSIVRISRDDRDRPAYAGNISIRKDSVSSDWAGALLDECPVSDWFPEAQLDEHRLWIGAAGQKSTIHSDPYDNLNVQIIGKKKFIIFAPDQHEYLYPEFIHPFLWASRIDLDLPDLERFPKFKSARGLVGELSPGDVLFIPKFWWHTFSAIETSLNINRWIFSEGERQQYWHEQSCAKKFIDYGELLCLLKEKFESLDSEGKDRYRETFEQLRSGISKLFDESKVSAGVMGGA